MKWKARDQTVKYTNFKDYITQIRGINNLDEFLNPTVDKVHNPLLLKNLPQVIERVEKAIQNNEKIVVVSDVDVDGVTSTVLMVNYLKQHTKNVDYIYHQRSEGHSILHDDVPHDTELLIILDSSSNEVEECQKLSESMDIIIIDHHQISRDNPYVLLVNPQQEGCKYPNKSICTALLVFKFIELMDYKHKKVDTNTLLDLVGLALLADAMDMSGLENRWFVSQALKQQYNIGLIALIKAKKLNQEKLTTLDFNFSIIPLINTVTRMDQIGLAFDLFFETDFFKAKKLANKFIELNNERKRIQNELFNYYLTILRNEKFVIVVSDCSSKNFNGVVANKLTDKFKKPALVLRKGQTYQGSYRSYGDFNIQEFLQQCPYVEYAEGHSQAGGCEILPENLDKFIEYINTQLHDVEFTSEIIYDIELSEDDLVDDFSNNVNWKFIDEISNFDYIHGIGFEPIKIRINDVLVYDRETVFKTKEHTRINTKHLDILKFNDPKYANNVDSFMEIDVVGNISINEWGGKKRLQFFIEDYKIKE